MDQVKLMYNDGNFESGFEIFLHTEMEVNGYKVEIFFDHGVLVSCDEDYSNGDEYRSQLWFCEIAMPKHLSTLYEESRFADALSRCDFNIEGHSVKDDRIIIRSMRRYSDEYSNHLELFAEIEAVATNLMEYLGVDISNAIRLKMIVATDLHCNECLS